MAMRHVRSLVVLAGIPLGLAAEWERLNGQQLVDSLPDLVVGWVLIACGLAALGRPPAARCGGLLIAAGFSWFLPNFAGAGPGIVRAIFASTLFLHRGFVVHLLLVYPSGTVRGRLGFWLVVAGYAASVTPTAWADGKVAIALSFALVAATAVQYRRSRGVERPACRAAFAAAVVFGSLVQR